MLTVSRNNSTLYQAVLGDGDGRADASLSLGVAGSDAIVPIVRSSKWGGEAELIINPTWFDASRAAVSAVSNGVIETTKGDCRIKAWTLGKGVLEYAVCYSSAPSIEQIELEVQGSSGLIWYPQGELTQKEVDEDCSRPANVIGSYAVYFNKAHGKYKTGKLAHCLRWEVIDADGRKTWCGYLQKDGGKLIIPLPVDWLKTAKYPITAMGAGDTIGYISGGLTSMTSEPGRVHGLQDQDFTPDTGGTMTAVKVFRNDGATATDATTFKGGVYDGDTAGSNRLAYSSTAADVPADDDSWGSVAIDTGTLTVTIGNTYVPCINKNGTTGLRVGYDAGGATEGYTLDTYAYTNNPPFDHPLGSLSVGGSRRVSMYLDYTVAGGTTRIHNPFGMPLTGPFGGF